MSHPDRIDLKVLDREPDIRGSVQELFRLDLGGKPYQLCRTTESGSVFDVGTIFSVPRSDVLRTIIRHAIFTALGDPATWRGLTEEDVKPCFGSEALRKDLLNSAEWKSLCEKGARTHHIGMVDAKTGAVAQKGLPEPPSNMVLIEAFPIFRPKRFELWGRHAWDYQHYFLEPRKVVGLENIFRLGSPGGSSLQKRYDTAAAKGPEEAKKFLLAVGMSEAPKPWEMFKDMIFDCTTKYEPEDRYLSWNETAMIAGVKGETFARMARTLAACTVYAAKFFRDLGFTLWDIKWEAAVDGDEVVVVDTIDPDSIRITGETEHEGRRVFIHFNKQSIRDYYRILHAEWYAAINDAKKRAETDPQGREFMVIYREGVARGGYPPIPLYDPKFAAIQSAKYELMVKPIIDPANLAAARAEAKDIMRREIEIYQQAGKLAEFLKLVS